MRKITVFTSLAVAAMFASLANAAVEFDYPISKRSPAENGGTMTAPLGSDLALLTAPVTSTPAVTTLDAVANDGEPGFGGGSGSAGTVGNPEGGVPESEVAGEDEAAVSTTSVENGSDANVTPEPASLIVWSVLAVVVAAGCLRRRRKVSH